MGNQNMTERNGLWRQLERAEQQMTGWDKIVTSTASEGKAPDFDLSALMSAAKNVVTAPSPPKEILVLPDGMMQMPLYLLRDTFGQDKWFISETQFEAIPKEPAETWLPMSARFRGVPVKRLRDVVPK